MNNLKKIVGYQYVFLLLIILAAFFLRVYGIDVNHPFWVDEIYTASQANVLLKHGLNSFTDPEVFIEHHNLTQYGIVALMFSLFGQSESAARIPSVFAGTFVIIALFFLSKSFFGKRTAYVSSILTTFSYLMITWSRQARGYMLQAFFILLTFIVYFKLLTEKKYRKLYVGILFSLFFLGALTHSMYYLVIGSLFIHFIYFHKESALKIIKRPLFYVVFGVIVIYGYVIGFYHMLGYFISSGSIGSNNLWYYHSFLWREYTLITFLSILGIVIGLIQYRRWTFLLAIYTFLHLFFVSFVFKPYISRYLVPLFPVLFIFSGLFISYFSHKLARDMKNIHIPYLSAFLSIGIACALVMNGHKFMNNPQTYYSVNHDFREIALIDYEKVYGIIKYKSLQTNDTVAIIDTFPDRAWWHVSFDYQPLYMFTWLDEEGYTNGLARKATYVLNEEGDKVIPPGNTIALITNVKDLKKVVAKYPKGFIFIDDTSRPQDVIRYAEKNFKKEIYLDHYPLDENPYSIWPATLYSWGFEET